MLGGSGLSLAVRLADQACASRLFEPLEYEDDRVRSFFRTTDPFAACVRASYRWYVSSGGLKVPRTS
jgi:hypothetical protein